MPACAVHGAALDGQDVCGCALARSELSCRSAHASWHCPFAALGIARSVEHGCDRATRVSLRGCVVRSRVDPSHAGYGRPIFLSTTFASVATYAGAGAAQHRLARRCRTYRPLPRRRFAGSRLSPGASGRTRRRRACVRPCRGFVRSGRCRHVGEPRPALAASAFVDRSAGPGPRRVARILLDGLALDGSPRASGH